MPPAHFLVGVTKGPSVSVSLVMGQQMFTGHRAVTTAQLCKVAEVQPVTEPRARCALG